MEHPKIFHGLYLRVPPCLVDRLDCSPKSVTNVVGSEIPQHLLEVSFAKFGKSSNEMADFPLPRLITKGKWFT